MKYSIKEVSKKLKLTEHSIRYYTNEKLVPCERDKNGRRVFNEESLNWLEGVKCLRKCGVSIKDIKIYSDLCLLDEQDAFQKRYNFIKIQRELAYNKLKDAQTNLEYLNHKLSHYEKILNNFEEDDTNPNIHTISSHS